MNYTMNRIFYVIEVSPSRYLASYLPEGRSVTTPHIFNPYDMEIVEQDIEGYYIWAERFISKEVFWEYIAKWGSKEDFFEWCKGMQEMYGGDGKPRFCKVNVEINAEVEEGKI